MVSNMNKLIVKGKNKLYGKVEVKSAKNALLPLIASCILLDFEVGFLNVPKLKDVDVMLEIIQCMGGKYRYEGDVLYVDCSSLHIPEIPCEQAKKIRASVFMLGPLLGRFHKVSTVKPGGCNLGERPIDLHLSTLSRLGAEVSSGDYVYLRADKLKGTKIRLPFSSVGVTENLIMASCVSEGETIILNSAKEPEIVCLANFLNRLGAKIRGAGTSVIRIEGVKKLKPNVSYFKPITDRIEVGTFLLCALNTGGEIEIEGADFIHNGELIKKIHNNTCKIMVESDKIYMKSCGVGKGLGYIKTAPYPGFPTDLQSLTLAYSCFLRGTTVIREGIFKDRFQVVNELKKMGANINITGDGAIVVGRFDIHGAEVEVPDLRGGASLILAGLNADGITTVNGASLIERGYDNIDKKLRLLGADIKRG